MPLTAEDVRKKRFTPVRLREGYDMREVDQFLDEVEAELARLRREPGQQGPGEGTSLTRSLAAIPGPRSSSSTAAIPDVGATGDAPPPGPGAGSLVETAPLTVSDAAGAAARLLEIAGRSADEVVAEAREQADSILSDARTAAQQLESEARAAADEIDSDASARRSLILGELERDRAQLAADVEELRTFESGYRLRLRTYLAAQLAELDGAEPAAETVPGPAAETVPGPGPGGSTTPSSLASLLGE